jgi:hypothetical protein
MCHIKTNSSITYSNWYPNKTEAPYKKTNSVITFKVTGTHTKLLGLFLARTQAKEYRRKQSRSIDTYSNGKMDGLTISLNADLFSQIAVDSVLYTVAQHILNGS